MKYLEQLRRALVTHAGLIKTLGKLHIGDKIKVPHSVMGDIVFLVADKDHAGYPANSVTLITEKIILHRAFDAKEPNNPNSSRQGFGNCKYSVSNIDQWLNSSASAGGWYTARHTYDQAPSSTEYVDRNPYDQDAGFLHGFHSAFVDSLLDTTITVALHTVDGGGYETIKRKFFFAAKSELFTQYIDYPDEGSMLALFSADTKAIRIAYTSEYASADNTAKGSTAIAAGTPYRWWCRSPVPSMVYVCQGVGADGSDDVNGRPNYGNGGVRPLCNLSSELRVSNTTDADGCYTLMI